MHKMAKDGRTCSPYLALLFCSHVWEGKTKALTVCIFTSVPHLSHTHSCTKIQSHRLNQLPRVPPRHLVSTWTSLAPPHQLARPLPRPDVENKSVPHVAVRPTRARAKTNPPNVPRSPAKQRSVKVGNIPIPSLLFFVVLFPYCRLSIIRHLFNADAARFYSCSLVRISRCCSQKRLLRQVHECCARHPIQVQHVQ